MPRLRVHSWPHTLTDWCVIRAFERAGCPGCLRKPPALAAAFVTEASRVLRIRTFDLPEAKLEALLEAAADSACEAAGGSAYIEVRCAATEAEDAYLRSITRQGPCPVRHERHLQCSATLAEHRRQWQRPTEEAKRRRARAYWSEERQQAADTDPFEHVSHDSPLIRLADFAPLWWSLFLHHLRTEFSRRVLAQFRLLDELPRLRRQARSKKVLAALVEEWRAAHAVEFGLPAQLHYHVLARRGAERARFVGGWFNARVPGYAADPQAADSARSELIEHLAALRSADWSRN